MDKSQKRAIIYPKTIEKALIEAPITSKLSKGDQKKARAAIEAERIRLLEVENALNEEGNGD